MAEIVIIGGGVAGLSAGIYAQMQGHRATVCEMHSVAGGNLTGWDRHGYHIDNCIHWLTGTNPATKAYKMWKELGALDGSPVYQGDTLYTCRLGRHTLSLSRDIYKLKADMLAISPKDREEISSLIYAVEIIQGINGIRGVSHNQGLSPLHTFFAIPTLFKYYSLTTKELSCRFTHPLLKSFITAFWGESFGALALIMVFAHFCGENGGIPSGSSCAMAKNMANRLCNLGGKLLLNKEAIRINHKNGRASSVCFSDGTEIKGDYIIVTTDPIVTFNKLLCLPMPPSLAQMYENPRLLRFSSYHCAFACDIEKAPFKGDYIFSAPEKYRSIVPTGYVIVREFSHEKDFAPEGKCILQTLVFCYEHDAKRFIYLKKTDIGAYQAKKQELKAAIEDMLTQELPQLKGKLSCIDVWTPATYQRYTNSDIGSYMSFALPSKMMPVRISSRIKGLENVLLATQWQQIPGGLPIAAKCGKKAIDAISLIELHKKHELKIATAR